jgi:hypothetical protein
MGEINRYTDGPDLLVELNHVLNSEFAGLIARLWENDEANKDAELGRWLQEEKRDFLDATRRDEDWFNEQEEKKTIARKTIVNMVGKRVLMRAQLERTRYDEAEYMRTFDRLEKTIEREIKSFTPSRTAATIGSVQPQMIDPDSDYPDDIATN